MAPLPPRKPVSRDRFPALLSSFKTQTYLDTTSRSSSVGTIRTIAWSPTGHLIATGAQDRTLRVWNPERAQVKSSTELRGHTGGIERVAWRPGREAELASVAADGTARFWDVRTKACIASVQLGARGLSLAWAPDGALVMLVRGGEKQVSSPPAGQTPGWVLAGLLDSGGGGPDARAQEDDALLPVAVPAYAARAALPQHGQTNEVLFAPLAPDAPRYTLLICAGTGLIKVATYPRAAADDAKDSSSADLQVVHTFLAHTSSCICAALSPTGMCLATGGSDAIVGLWNTRDWVCRRTLDQPLGTVRQVGFSWDGGYVVAAAEEGTGLDIAHAESGEYVYQVPTAAPPTCVAWHPNRYWLAYAGDPGGLKIVGTVGGQP